MSKDSDIKLDGSVKDATEFDIWYIYSINKDIVNQKTMLMWMVNKETE
jgi:hypothetical protein